MYIVFTTLVLFDRRVGPSPPSNLNPLNFFLFMSDKGTEDQVNANDPVPLVSLEKLKKKNLDGYKNTPGEGYISSIELDR